MFVVVGQVNESGVLIIGGAAPSNGGLNPH